MVKLDPGLRFLAGQQPPALEMLARESLFNVTQEIDQTATVVVLVQFTGDVSALQASGLDVDTVAGDIAAGSISLDRLHELEASDGVVQVEASRVLRAELDQALPEANITVVHGIASEGGMAGYRGSGVIVGVIDSGIDFAHPAFRRKDGTTRILAIWDQGLVPRGREASPAGFSFGVEFTRAAIDAALAAEVRHQDHRTGAAVFHGTHVAGIAAGNGSVDGYDQPAGTFVGAAPEAYIVCVATNRGRAEGELGLGDSRDTIAAVQYIARVATAAGLPVVMNLSLGDNLGPHDGTSPLERALTAELAGPGRVMVKSAGNEGDSGCHAGGILARGATQWVKFRVPTGRRAPVVVDLWYASGDRFEVAVASPDGDRTPPISPGSDIVGMLGSDHVFVGSDVDHPGNHENRITLVLSPTTGAALTAGDWSVVLTGQVAVSGQWDAWIQRSEASIRCEFHPPFRNPASTISIPGTTRSVITVGSYVSRGPDLGVVSPFSSRGPTRDGRSAPTLAAPGQQIIAPQPPSTGDTYGKLQGTSMAAPLVAGVVALMLEKNPNLTTAQVREALVTTARHDRRTGTTPNDWWGAGKIDAEKALAAVTVPGQPDSENSGPESATSVTKV